MGIQKHKYLQSSLSGDDILVESDAEVWLLWLRNGEADFCIRCIAKGQFKDINPILFKMFEDDFVGFDNNTLIFLLGIGV